MAIIAILVLAQNANLRFDKKNIILRTPNEQIDTKLNKFGCVMEDNVKTGINTKIKPGQYIQENSWII